MLHINRFSCEQCTKKMYLGLFSHGTDSFQGFQNYLIKILLFIHRISKKNKDILKVAPTHSTAVNPMAYSPDFIIAYVTL